MDYKIKYFKYKMKYLKLKKNLQGGAQKGKKVSAGAAKEVVSCGIRNSSSASASSSKSDIPNLLEIIDKYYRIPNTNLYDEDESFNINIFKKYVLYFKRLYKNDKKFKLEKKICFLQTKQKRLLKIEKNLNEDEIKELQNKIDALKIYGRKSNEIGKIIEIKARENINRLFDDTFQKYYNFKLFETVEVDKEGVIHYNKIDLGEIDAIIIKDNVVEAICEVKKSFDDIPDAYFQILRTYKHILSKNPNITLEGKLPDKTYIMINISDLELKVHRTPIDLSYIYTNFDENTKITNIQSSLKHNLARKIACWNLNKKTYKSSYRKVWKGLKDIQKNKNKYKKDVLSTVEIFGGEFTRRIILV